jgi:hypothetical protein
MKPLDRRTFLSRVGVVSVASTVSVVAPGVALPVGGPV